MVPGIKEMPSNDDRIVKSSLQPFVVLFTKALATGLDK
jgi:hypothetical protein